MTQYGVRQTAASGGGTMSVCPVDDIALGKHPCLIAHTILSAALLNKLLSLLGLHII